MGNLEPTAIFSTRRLASSSSAWPAGLRASVGESDSEVVTRSRSWKRSSSDNAAVTGDGVLRTARMIPVSVESANRLPPTAQFIHGLAESVSAYGLTSIQIAMRAQAITQATMRWFKQLCKNNRR